VLSNLDIPKNADQAPAKSRAKTFGLKKQKTMVQDEPQAGEEQWKDSGRPSRRAIVMTDDHVIEEKLIDLLGKDAVLANKDSAGSSPRDVPDQKKKKSRATVSKGAGTSDTAGKGPRKSQSTGKTEQDGSPRSASHTQTVSRKSAAPSPGAGNRKGKSIKVNPDSPKEGSSRPGSTDSLGNSPEQRGAATLESESTTSPLPTGQPSIGSPEGGGPGDYAMGQANDEAGQKVQPQGGSTESLESQPNSPGVTPTYVNRTKTDSRSTLSLGGGASTGTGGGNSRSTMSLDRSRSDLNGATSTTSGGAKTSRDSLSSQIEEKDEAPAGGFRSSMAAAIMGKTSSLGGKIGFRR
jgi:hypothetical protein